MPVKTVWKTVVLPGQLGLDDVERGILAHFLGAETGELVEHLLRRTQAQLVEIELFGVVVQLSGLFIAAERDHGLHRQAFPVGKRVDVACNGTELLKLEEILVRAQDLRRVFHTAAEQALEAPCLLRNPDHRGFVRQKLAVVPVGRVHIQRKLFLPVGRGLCLVYQAFEFSRVLHDLQLVCPEEHAAALLDEFQRRKPRLDQLLFGVVNHALQRMMDVAHVPILEEQLLQAVARHAVLTVMQQDLQQIGHL